MGSIRIDKPRLYLGWTCPFHMAIHHCIRVASNGIWSLNLSFYCSSLYHVTTQKAHCMSVLTSDYQHVIAEQCAWGHGCCHSWPSFTDWKSHGLVAGDDNRQCWQLKCPAAPADWTQTWFTWCCGSPTTIRSQRGPWGCHHELPVLLRIYNLSSWGPLLSPDTVCSHKNEQRLRLG